MAKQAKADFLAMRELGMSNVEIGKLYGLSHECVRENIGRALNVSNK